MHVAQAERQRRFIDIRQHSAEEPFVFCLADAEPCLRHRVAERRCLGQFVPAPGQDQVDLLLHHRQGRVVADQVMPLLEHAPTAFFPLCGDKAQQRCARQIRPHAARIKQRRQPRTDLALCRIEPQFSQRQLGLAPHHLHR